VWNRDRGAVAASSLGGPAVVPIGFPPLGRIERLFRAMWPRLFRFALVGIAATGADFAIFNLVLVGRADATERLVLLANTLAFATATLLSYALNSRFTFQAGNERRALLRYVGVAVGGAVVYDLGLLAAIRVLDADTTVALNVAKVGAVALSATWNFIGFAFFAFASPRGARARV
jgi:putative flippase GtrA